MTRNPSIAAAKRTHRVDLDDDHVCPQPVGPVGHAAPAIAVTDHDEVLSGQEDVGGADDAVDRRLAGPVVVVEQMLGGRVVDCDHRDSKGAIGRHRLETDDTGGRLLGGADDLDVPPIGVEQRGQVGSVIHRDRRCVVEHGVDVLVIGVGVLAT